MDHIRVYVDGNDKIAGIIKANENAIAEKVLADEICYGATCETTKSWGVNGEDVTIGVCRI